MAKQFGCKLQPENISPFFPNPAEPSKQIAVIFDACHMLKLMRNMLHAYKTVSIPGVGLAKFEHLECLQKVQENEGLRAANKITRRHIEFSQQKMKVKLAAQLFSASVGKALVLGRVLGVEGLENSEATECMCLTIDKLFDLLNSKSAFARGYKAPLTSNKLEYHRKFLNETRTWLLGLRTEAGKLLCESARSMGVIGLAADITSVLYLADTYLGVELGPGKPMKYLLTYKLSQDHLEQFFGCVRRAGGSNNNPNAKQFVSIFKRLMFRSGVSLSPTDNANTDAQDDTSLVHVQTDKYQLNSMENIERNELFEDGLDSRTYLSATIRLSPFIENVLVYMSGWVVRSLFTH